MAEQRKKKLPIKASPFLWGKCLALAANAVRKYGLAGLRLVRREAAALYWDRVYGPAR